MGIGLNLGFPREIPKEQGDNDLYQKNKDKMVKMMNDLREIRQNGQLANFDKEGNVALGDRLGNITIITNSIVTTKSREGGGKSKLSIQIDPYGNFILKNEEGGKPIILKQEEATEWLEKFQSRVDQAKEILDKERKEKLKELESLAKNEDQSGTQNLLNDTSKVWI